MSLKVHGLTRVARENARAAVALSGDAKRAFENIQAAIKALADAVDELDEKLGLKP